jgi:hypothetical protein
VVRERQLSRSDQATGPRLPRHVGAWVELIQAVLRGPTTQADLVCQERFMGIGIPVRSWWPSAHEAAPAWAPGEIGLGIGAEPLVQSALGSTKTRDGARRTDSADLAISQLNPDPVILVERSLSRTAVSGLRVEIHILRRVAGRGRLFRAQQRLRPKLGSGPPSGQGCDHLPLCSVAAVQPA